MSLKKFGWILSIFAFVISAALITTAVFMGQTHRKVGHYTNEYIAWKDSAQSMQAGSDELTAQARGYVATGEDKYMDGYFIEAASNRRQNALNTIKEYLSNTVVYSHLEASLKESINLMNTEYYAMRLMMDVVGKPIDDTTPEEIRAVILSDEDIALATHEKHHKAITYMYDDNYAKSKTIIIGGVNEAVTALNQMLGENLTTSNRQLTILLIIQEVLVFLVVAFMVGTSIVLYFYVIKPIYNAVDALIKKEKVDIVGLSEYQYIARTYNDVREENEKYEQNLRYQADHDKLTSLANRNAYDALLSAVELDKSLFLLIDIDKFKEVNDEYGHSAGDKVLKRVSKILSRYFSGEKEHIYRIGGDEFAIIIENSEPYVISDIINRCEKMNEELFHNKELKITISIGVAEGYELDTPDTIFRKADIALYHTKQNGRGGVTLYEDSLKSLKNEK